MTDWRKLSRYAVGFTAVALCTLIVFNLHHLVVPSNSPLLSPHSIPIPPPLTSPNIPSPSPPGYSYSNNEELYEEQQKSREASEKLLEKAVKDLPLGESFHNIPDKMKANVPVLVKAGIAPSVTEQLLKQLNVNDTVSTEKNVRYDPLGVEIKLKVDDKMFRVRSITEGRKPIIPGDPAIWMWELTPLKRGKTVITIQALVDLKVPGIDDSYKRDEVVFLDEREVQINLGYTVSQAIANYWKEISAVMFGSGSIAALFKWWIERKSQQEKTSEKSQDIVGFARSLPRNRKNSK